MYLPKITDDIIYVGVNDRNINIFEKYIPVNNGVSYNSYLILDKKTCLLDTVDFSGVRDFIENVKMALDGRKLDYLVVHHMEPDHCASIEELLLRCPDVTIVSNAQVFKMIDQFFNIKYKKLIVKENDILDLGNHQLKFISAPFVHWPEVMFSYDLTSKILFSADAFGSFGALSGNLFYDEVNDELYLSEARRYYSNIVGKYGQNVQNAFKKVSNLEISMICPLHGYLWRENFDIIIQKYMKWSLYEAEDRNVVIVYASMYGNTEKAANILAYKLASKGVKNIKIYDISITNETYIISEIFRASHLVIASPTYNMGIYPKTKELLDAMIRLNVKNRYIGLIENSTWAAFSNKLILEELNKLQGINVFEQKPSLKSSVKVIDEASLQSLADEIASSL